MKKFHFLLAIIACCMIACSPKNAPEEPDTNPKQDPDTMQIQQPDTTPILDTLPVIRSFPRKHLIEHFTGVDCPYCVNGMSCIQSFLDTTKQDFIWVSHHYGYKTDAYTISASSSIASRVGITSAPSIVIDRIKRTIGRETAFSFHPGYLEDGVFGRHENDHADTSLVSVVIEHSYDAETRHLDVTVSGQVLDTTLTKLSLTILMKENGLIGKQADAEIMAYWPQFRHNKVIRVVMTQNNGDEIVIDPETHTYTCTKSYEVPAKWVAENCVIVAYACEKAITAKPILNAEQTPLVAGTDGGESLRPEPIQ